MLVACTSEGDGVTKSGGSGHGQGTSGTGAQSSLPGSNSTAGESSTTLVTSAGEAPFIGAYDADEPVYDCDPFEVDCPPGEKCQVYDDDQHVQRSRCVREPSDPRTHYETCERQGDPPYDDCDHGLLCFPDDAGSPEGVCVEYCAHYVGLNDCALDPHTTCPAYEDPKVLPCLYECDPLLQDCPTGTGACYDQWRVPSGFACEPHRPRVDDGVYGSMCQGPNLARESYWCQPGLFCARSWQVPGCVPESCCTRFCDLDDKNADQSCDGFADGQRCLPWDVVLFPAELPPPPELGMCSLP
jgi:hypothetical protein